MNTRNDDTTSRNLSPEYKSLIFNSKLPFSKHIIDRTSQLQPLPTMVKSKSSKTEKNEAEAKRKALKSQVHALHAEMEIADYGINEHTGRSKRKVSRKKQKERTIKRKSLEKEDMKDSAVHRDKTTNKRLRGSKAALEDEVIKGSLIFGENDFHTDDDESDAAGSKIRALTRNIDKDEDYEGSEDDEEEGRYELYHDELKELHPDEYSSEEDDDNDDIDDIDEDEADAQQNQTKNKRRTATNYSLPSDPTQIERIEAAKKQFPQKKIARTMYRLRNFKSHRMAEKHGDALGRHARGLNRSAVAKLKEVASAAPIAPQIYSSLGLVYESMLSDELNKVDATLNDARMSEQAQTNGNEVVGSNLFNDEMDINACIELAKKTFGSYHVAALLCKMDYTLWLRAGDAAMKVAELHGRCLFLRPTLDEKDTGDEEFSTMEEYLQHHRVEKHKWLEEAKGDYIAADNINPPGIAVPAKLAHAHIQLGNLSEALTILTDLKKISMKSNINLREEEGLKSRSELERSYAIWLLYADLMLIIGYECNKWNRGDQTNNNYMFRRWLRKFSKSFDWRERRLQSLCLALEAATGSSSCEEIVALMKNRGISSHNEKDEYDLDGHTATVSTNVNESTDIDNSVSNPASSQSSNLHSIGLALDKLSKQFDGEREALISKHQEALHTIDEAALASNSSKVSRRRKDLVSDREHIIKDHKSALLNLATQYRLQKQAFDSAIQENRSQSVFKPIKLSASCSTVIDIASQLMKLCLGMQQYHLGSLVASVVSLYFKERALRTEIRKENLLAFNQRQIAASSNILQLSKEVYDDLHDENNKPSDDEDSILYLSDEEDFETVEGEDIVKTMKCGILPPELQVLHGICLVGEGGKNFLAGKLIEATTSLEDEYAEVSIFNSEESIEDTPFHLFRNAMTETLTKPAAYALLVDVVSKVKKEIHWADRLLPLYENYLIEIENSDEVKLLQMNPSALSMTMSTRRSYHVKTLLAILRMRLIRAEKLLPQGNVNLEQKIESYDITMSVIDTIFNYQTTLLLDIQKKASSDEVISTVILLSNAFKIISNLLQKSGTRNELILIDIFSRLRNTVSWMCQTSIPSHDDIYSSNSDFSFGTWRHFPLSTEWQNEELKTLSLRTFNLCVGCNVSTFSGWEKSEFDLKLLKRRQGPSYFGAHLNGDQVAGFFDQLKENELGSQWKQIETLLPLLSCIDFDGAMRNVKESKWRKEAILDLESNFIDTPVAAYAEDEALFIILMFSNMCLQLTSIEQNTQKQQCLLKNAMSIILPMSQFGLDQTLWDSSIGTNATKNDSSISEWELFAQNGEATVSKPACRQKTSSTKKSGNRNQSMYISDSSVKYKSPLSKLVKVPVEILLKEWKGSDNFDGSDDEEMVDIRLNKWSQTVSGPAKLAMKRVDYTLQKLRESSTINSLQKSSLQVAGALLELIATKECQNPILCLHQAGVFASQGAKGGNNDEVFKKTLPEESECTPDGALIILGRADCLRAIQFIDESIFLCSYVAKICRLHRDKQSDLPWNPKWRVIAILMYTISLAIDATINSFMEGDDRDNTLKSWTKDVKAEISRARSDAIALQKAFSRKQFNQKKPSKNDELEPRIDSNKHVSVSHCGDDDDDESYNTINDVVDGGETENDEDEENEDFDEISDFDEKPVYQHEGINTLPGINIKVPNEEKLEVDMDEIDLFAAV